MADPTQKGSDIFSYPVEIVERDGHVELTVRELLITVRGPDMPTALALLAERKKRTIEWARTVGLLDDMPVPTTPLPLVGDSLWPAPDPTDR